MERTSSIRCDGDVEKNIFPVMELAKKLFKRFERKNKIKPMC